MLGTEPLQNFSDLERIARVQAEGYVFEGWVTEDRAGIVRGGTHASARNIDYLKTRMFTTPTYTNEDGVYALRQDIRSDGLGR